MSLAYIRAYYGVPAKRRGRVRYTGGSKPVLGTITGASHDRLAIKLDGNKHSHPFHPTWEIEYLDAPTRRP